LRHESEFSAVLVDFLRGSAGGTMMAAHMQGMKQVVSGRGYISNGSVERSLVGS
jgi:hypothetical protein